MPFGWILFTVVNKQVVRRREIFYKMHKYMRAIGFSNLNRHAQNELIENVIEHPQQKRIAKNAEGEAFVELSREFAENMGITVRGILDENGAFLFEHYYPYLIGQEITAEESIEIEKYSDKEAYAGICDDMHLGVTLVFYMQNVAEYLELLSKRNQDAAVKNLENIYEKGAVLAALSMEGKILLPIADHAKVRKTAYNFNEKTKQASDRNQDMEDVMDRIENMEMDTYEMISRRIDQKEDIFSIVSSTFMPDGIETDQYSILGEILEYKFISNTYSKETICRMKIYCNGLTFDICINEDDLLGVPEEGRRFKGKIWMQGVVCL